MAAELTLSFTHLFRKEEEIEKKATRKHRLHIIKYFVSLHAQNRQFNYIFLYVEIIPLSERNGKQTPISNWRTHMSERTCSKEKK